MTHWSDIYPHKIWTNIITLDNKFIDYKIGGEKREKGSWSLSWTDEMIERFDEIKVISTYEEVNDDSEHENAFGKGSELVNEYKNEYGNYYQNK